MSARKKLNLASVYGALVLAAMAGLLSQSGIGMGLVYRWLPCRAANGTLFLYLDALRWTSSVTLPDLLPEGEQQMDRRNSWAAW